MIMKCGCIVLSVMMMAAHHAAAGEKYPAVGKVVRFDPRLDELIAKDVQMEKIAGGFIWTEGTAWVSKGGYLLFSDIPNNVVMKWKDGEGTSKFVFPAGYTGDKPRGGKPGDEPGSNGLRIDPEGRLTLCEHGDRRVARLDVVLAPGTAPQIGSLKKTTLADKYMGKRLNSPNDLVFTAKGDLYFTDPPYGLPKHFDDPTRELDFCGVYLLKKDGKLTLLTKEINRPNGIALSPDEKTLYVANSERNRPVWTSFAVKADGTIGEGKVFYDASKFVQEKKPGAPDGLKVDVKGNLFATGPGGVLIITPEGSLLGLLETGVPTANCSFGDDGTLYIAANHDIFRIRTRTKGK
jgi:gluconolactonase